MSQLNHGLENISPWLDSSQMGPEMAILEQPETQLRKSNANGGRHREMPKAYVAQAICYI